MSQSTNRDVYIYYRVPSQWASIHQMRVAVMQARLSEKYGIATALKRRSDEKEGCHTWMEVYLSTSENFEEMLKDAVTKAELTSLIQGQRHTEYFFDLSSGI